MIILHRWHPSFNRLYYYYIILFRVFATAKAKWENLRIHFSSRREHLELPGKQIYTKSIGCDTSVVIQYSKWPTKKTTNHKHRIWSLSCFCIQYFSSITFGRLLLAFQSVSTVNQRSRKGKKAIAECVSVGGRKRFSTNCANGIRWDGRLRGANDEKGKRINVSYRLAGVVCVCASVPRFVYRAAITAICVRTVLNECSYMRLARTNSVLLFYILFAFHYVSFHCICCIASPVSFHSTDYYKV